MAPEVESERLDVVRALANLSAVDWMYADHYVHRASELLAPICSREDYAIAEQQLNRLPAVIRDLQLAAQCDDWAMVDRLAERGARLCEHIGRVEPLIDIAKLVYGAPVLGGVRAALTLTGVLDRGEEQRTGCAAALAQLRRLAVFDDELADFYRSRAAYFESVTPIAGNGHVRQTGFDPLSLRREISQATAHNDFQRVRDLIGQLHAGVPVSAVSYQLFHGPSALATESLRAPIPAEAVAAGRRVGLMPVLLPEVDRYDSYLATAADSGLEPVLRENLDLLRHHIHVTSAATRYLPWFGVETLLVEDFDEAHPDAASPLLDLLEIPRRRGVARRDLESRLRGNSVRVCRSLDLDPTEFCVASIPFDAYLRLAPERGWGERPLWTHFDGYRLTPEGDTLALVGGNSDYGGRLDLCGVERDYDAPRLIVRLAILRRLRLSPRITPPTQL